MLEMDFDSSENHLFLWWIFHQAMFDKSWFPRFPQNRQHHTDLKNVDVVDYPLVN